MMHLYIPVYKAFCIKEVTKTQKNFFLGSINFSDSIRIKRIMISWRQRSYNYFKPERTIEYL